MKKLKAPLWKLRGQAFATKQRRADVARLAVLIRNTGYRLETLATGARIALRRELVIALDDLDGLCDQVYDQIAALVVDDAIQREQQADKPDSE